MLYTTLNVTATVFFLIAAGFWLIAGKRPAQPNPTFDGSLGREFEESLHASAAANRRAAIFTGVGVLLQAAASVAH